MTIEQKLEQKSKMSGKLYTETMYYSIKLTEKYAKTFMLQLFEKLDTPVTPDGFMVLNIVKTNLGICQRDVAKLIFSDRANTGRLLENLESKELIKRQDDTKNNRPVKKIFLTKKGEKILNEVSSKIFPILDQIAGKFTQKEISIVNDVMKRIRDGFDGIIETQI